MLNSDYREMLQCLSGENVSFLLIGAYAVAAYGFPRATKDIDILVGPSPDNASSVMKALARFGAPLDGVSAEDFSTEGIVFQIGNSPRRIDILTRISGVEFQQAYERRQVVELEGIQVPVISLEDLIANKRATGRLQDLADVERLESVRLGEPQK
ncbi:MAG: nucleotidyltransferase [Proteobacteria bacterium]|nr:nucleotidyltransferase [Pseudomonadota bacterium]